jgi:hypothetical protein
VSPEEERGEEESDIGGRHLRGRHVVLMRKRLQEPQHVQQHLEFNQSASFIP